MTRPLSEREEQRAIGAGVADLDKLRDWARAGSEMLASVTANLEPQLRAMQAGVGSDDDAQARALVAGLDIMMAGMFIRGAPIDPIALHNALATAWSAVDQLQQLLPKHAIADDAAAIDTAFKHGGMTSEETAIAIGISVENLNKRRSRRR